MKNKLRYTNANFTRNNGYGHTPYEYSTRRTANKKCVLSGILIDPFPNMNIN